MSDDKKPQPKVEKFLKVVPDGRGMYDIVMNGGGPIPDALRGKYTSYEMGNRAISHFQAGVRDRVDSRAKG